MNRASPVDLRTAKMTAHQLAEAGIDFVCIPVLDDADKQKLLALLSQRLEAMEKDAES